MSETKKHDGPDKSDTWLIDTLLKSFWRLRKFENPIADFIDCPGFKKSRVHSLDTTEDECVLDVDRLGLGIVSQLFEEELTDLHPRTFAGQRLEVHGLDDLTSLEYRTAFVSGLVKALAGQLFAFSKITAIPIEVLRQSLLRDLDYEFWLKKESYEDEEDLQRGDLIDDRPTKS